MNKTKIHLIGGGTVSHVRNHLALCAPAYGMTVNTLYDMFRGNKDSATLVSTRPQVYNECGSHQCGQNTSDGLRQVDLGDGHFLKSVYLDQHGPNIVFSKTTPAEKVIAYIDRTFDLSAKTGGLV